LGRGLNRGSFLKRMLLIITWAGRFERVGLKVSD